MTYKVAKLIKRPDDERFHFGYAHFAPQLNLIKALLMITLCVFALASALNSVLEGGNEFDIRIKRGRAAAPKPRATTSMSFVSGSVKFEIGLPPAEIPVALLFFNVGVEIGQLLFVAALLTLAAALRPLRRRAPDWAAVVPVYAIGVVATYWFLERTTAIVGRG